MIVPENMEDVEVMDHKLVSHETNITCRHLREILLSVPIAVNRGIITEWCIGGIDSLRKDVESITKKNDILSRLIQRNVKCQVECQGLMPTTLKRLTNYYNQLIKENELSERNLQTHRENNERLEKEAADLQEKLGGLETKFEEDKRSAVESYEKVLEEEFKSQLVKMKKELGSALSSLDYITFHQSRTLEENEFRERQLEKKYEGELEQKLAKVRGEIENEKKEWECIMWSEMEKERAELEKSLRREIELELQEESQRNMEIMVSQAKLACLEEQRLVEEAEIDKALADAKKQWQEEHKKDVQQLTRKRKRTSSEC